MKRGGRRPTAVKYTREVVMFLSDHHSPDKSSVNATWVSTLLILLPALASEKSNAIGFLALEASLCTCSTTQPMPTRFVYP